MSNPTHGIIVTELLSDGSTQRSVHGFEGNHREVMNKVDALATIQRWTPKDKKRFRYKTVSVHFIAYRAFKVKPEKPQFKDPVVSRDPIAIARSTNFLLSEMVEQMQGVDITGDSQHHIQVELAKRPDGKPVVYIHCEGITLLRLCQPKGIEIIDNR